MEDAMGYNISSNFDSTTEGWTGLSVYIYDSNSTSVRSTAWYNAQVDYYYYWNGSYYSSYPIYSGSIYQSSASSYPSSNGQFEYFSAPSAYLGNKSQFYGGEISFHQWAEAGTDQADDVVITGANGKTIVFDINQYSGWSYQSIYLDVRSAWKLQQTSTINDIENINATSDDIKSVLSNVSSIRIRNEFGNDSQLNSALDYFNMRKNTAPVPGSYASISLKENSSISISTNSITSLASDAEGDAISLYYASALNGTITYAQGEIIYTPNHNYSGRDTITYYLSDNDSGFSSGSFFVDVNAVNDAPVVAQALTNKSVAEDTRWSYTIPAGTFSDIDGDALTLSATLENGSLLPSWLNFDAATRTFSGTPPQDYNGSLALRVTASDGTLSAASSFTLTVTPVNDAPVVAQALTNQSVAEDTRWSYTIPAGTFSDIDGDALT
ncbi:tandem-95 repeat protein, partial [Methylobacterium nonmethylotrophicum]